MDCRAESREECLDSRGCVCMEKCEHKFRCDGQPVPHWEVWNVDHQIRHRRFLGEHRKHDRGSPNEEAKHVEEHFECCTCKTSDAMPRGRGCSLVCAAEECFLLDVLVEGCFLRKGPVEGCLLVRLVQGPQPPASVAQACCHLKQRQALHFLISKRSIRPLPNC